MKNRILLGLGVLLLVVITACASSLGEPFHSVVLGDAQYNTVSSNVMAVFYNKTEPNGGLYLFWCDLSVEIIDNGDGTWDISSPQVTATGVNQLIVDYDYYKYKIIEPVYDDEGFKLPQYMDELGLEPPSADDLPHSQHIGKLVDVDVDAERPATVTRKWHGISFDVDCWVSDTVVALWVADTLNVGDYVIVSFIEEEFEEQVVILPIVVDKIYESWE